MAAATLPGPVPDAVVFVDAIPKTSTGKHLKSAVRNRFKDHAW